MRHPPPRLSVRHVIWECTYFLWTRIFVPSTHYPSPLFTDQPLTLSLRVSSMVSPSLHCQDWPVLLSFKATQSPPPPALSPSLLARITGVKPLSYPGQTFPSRPYASHYETSPPPPRLSVRHVVWERTYFSQTVIFISNTHYPPPPPLLTGHPVTLSLRVSSMVSPSLHRQGWPVLLSCPPPCPTPSTVSLRVSSMVSLSYHC